MRKTIVLGIALVLLVSLMGCGGDSDDAAVGGYAPNQEAVAYAYTHGGYVGRAIVTVDAEGDMTAELDEAFLPHTLAEVDMESGEWTNDNTVFFIQRGEEVRVAKFISYDGTTFVGTTVGGAMIYLEAGENGEPVGTQDLEQQILRNQTTMATYYDGIGDGAFAVMTEFGGSPMVVTTTGYGGLYKRGSTYWNFGIGWQGNIDAIEEFVAENGAGGTLDEMVQNSDNVWEVADAETGATASDFKDYFGLIQAAAGRLTLN
jgi:hypothetical protein